MHTQKSSAGGFILVLLLGAALYVARSGDKMVQSYLGHQRQEIACQAAEDWLDRALQEDSSRKKAAKSTLPEIEVLRRHCWKPV